LKKYLVTSLCSFAMLLALTFFSWGSAALAAPVSTTTSSHARITFKHACASVPAGYARCSALVAQLENSAQYLAVHPNANLPGGSAPYEPSNLQSAYNLPATASGTPTVAIVDAYNDPNAASDLATYRSTFGLPACTVASGCLTIMSQTGSTTSLPSNNVNWAVEESLDLDMVSAICENCHILLVEAKSSSFANLGTAVNEAVSKGAIAVSNSYGGGESSGESSTCSSYYQHTFVAVTASSGDSGLGVEVPAACPYVTAVGGTTLNSDGSETAWNTSSTEGAGGGCSAFISEPFWQDSSLTGCGARAVADVSADADPNTGVYVYDSYGGYDWIEVGGTSESSPIIAAVYALAGNVASTEFPAELPWDNYTFGCLFQVGGVSYSYQTGLGSPNGTGCF
jgi:subtilase family serine protease